MIMIKKLRLIPVFAITCTLFSLPLSIAQAEKPGWQTIGDMMDSFNETPDRDTLQNIFYRCAALSHSTGERQIQLDDQESGDLSLNKSKAQIAIAVMMQVVNPDRSDIPNPFEVLESEMFKLLVNNYHDWYDYNLDELNGEFEDPELQEEYRICDSVTAEMLPSIMPKD